MMLFAVSSITFSLIIEIIWSQTRMQQKRESLKLFESEQIRDPNTDGTLPSFRRLRQAGTSYSVYLLPNKRPYT